MSIKDVISDIESEVSDVLLTDFSYVNTNIVPNRSDNQLTFERNVSKRGKCIKTCVLYVDIRDSVKLTETLDNQTMGKLYTAFSKSVLKIAKYHSGHIRNIIGDRIMIVFPSENCFKNAIDCAITINHVSSKVINNLFHSIDFKCGIGIDYGELKVIKVGVQMRGHEGTENKSLVWVGYPANIASRLTDVASKIINKKLYQVNFRLRHPLSTYLLPNVSHTKAFPGLFGQNLNINSSRTVTLSPEEFADNIYQDSNGNISFKKGELISFKQILGIQKYPSILITESVYKGLHSDSPNHTCVTNSFFKEQSHNIKNVRGKIYGANVIWVI